MKGLAKGIEDSKGMVAKAMDGVANDMVISPSLTAAAADGGSYSTSDTSGIISAIQTAFAGLQQSGGDTVIPVYIGGTMLDEIVVNAQQRVNLRSGGR